MRVKPKIEVLPEAQRLLFFKLIEVPNYFVLYGGTAIALRYGHRQSVDFDFFTTKKNINLEDIGRKLPFMKSLEQNGDLHCRKYNENHVDFTLTFNCGMVKVSLINNRDLIAGAVNAPDAMNGNNVKVASPLDLMAGKILALHNRTDAKDYYDMYELVKNGISLQKGYEAAYAIAKLSRLGTSQLMLDRLNSEFKSKTVELILSESHLPIISTKAKECSEILKKAASEVRLERIQNTRIRAVQSLKKSISF